MRYATIYMKALKENIILINALAAFSFGFIWIADGKWPWKGSRFSIFIHRILNATLFNQLYRWHILNNNIAFCSPKQLIHRC